MCVYVLCSWVDCICSMNKILDEMEILYFRCFKCEFITQTKLEASASKYMELFVDFAIVLFFVEIPTLIKEC